jgi:uncharacterized protein with PIN domain
LTSSRPAHSGGGRELRLLCDEMLKGVGRWLRAAGYDVAIVDDGADDHQLLARARAERRVLLTCDRRLARRSEDDAGVLVLGTEHPDGAALELSERLGIEWLHAPFTRCLVDNAPLMPASEEELARIPASARDGDAPILRCPRCHRVYWQGSHVRRMQTRLARWHRAGARS